MNFNCRPTGGGKTAIYGVLKNALTSLYQAKVDHPFYQPVDTYILNPKAVAIGELYGDINPLTFEWHDGLLGIMVRNAVLVCAQNRPENTKS